MNMNLMWNSKAVSTGLTVLKYPIVGEGKVVFNNYVIDMTVVGRHEAETCKLIFKTRPLNIAMIPFFDWP